MSGYAVAATIVAGAFVLLLLLVVGAARCGTTALTSFLGEHPDVFVSTPKEPHS